MEEKRIKKAKNDFEEDLFCRYHLKNRGCNHPLTIKKEKLNPNLKYYCTKKPPDLYLIPVSKASVFCRIGCEGCSAFIPRKGLVLKLKLQLTKTKAEFYDALAFELSPPKKKDNNNF